MKFLVINGPNINFLGIREKEVYGEENYESLIEKIEKYAEEIGVDIETYQSNHEGDLVDAIQEAYFNKVDGIVINPAAYTHTSIVLLDALKAVNIPFVEVHISDLSKRESFRQTSYVGLAAKKRIIGHGLNGYLEAMEYLKELLG